MATTPTSVFRFDTPDSLGEKFHPHKAKADVLYWQGQALQALGDKSAAGERFLAAASETGDFQEMARFA